MENSPSAGVSSVSSLSSFWLSLTTPPICAGVRTVTFSFGLQPPSPGTRAAAMVSASSLLFNLILMSLRKNGNFLLLLEAK